MGDVSCEMCHTEHKGALADIVEINDVQCASCHKDKFTSFSRGHPAFSDRFPYFRRTAIRFDHASHFAKHFADQRFTDRAPPTCAACHGASTDKRSLVRAGFEKTCAACHGNQMAQRELVLLRLPEFPEPGIDREIVLDACGPTPDEIEKLIERNEERLAAEEAERMEEEEEEEEYESVSDEEKSIVGAYLLDVTADDPDEYTEPMQELILAMADGGVDLLAESVDERAGEAVSGGLLAGLNPEVVKRVACAWAANLGYEAPAEASMGGWYGDTLELRYRPKGHADTVAKAWIEFGLGAAQTDDDSGERAVALRDSLIDAKEGVGACTKCHAVSQVDPGSDALVVEWRARHVERSRPHHLFLHDLHLRLLAARETNLVEADAGCRRCHVLDAGADFASGFADFDTMSYKSNFKAITKDTCVDCHSEGNVAESCQMCHDYHRAPSFQIMISGNEQ